MTIVKFPGYGVTSPEVSIVASRVVSWYPISYNGNTGTEIYLDTGKTVAVGAASWDVDKAMSAALREPQ